MQKEMTIRERQLHMAQLIKQWDRMLVEKKGKAGYPFYHYQKTDAAPGERDSVCVVISKTERIYLAYGVELEEQANAARLWVKNGGGKAPQLIETTKRAIRASAKEIEEELDSHAPKSSQHNRRMIAPPNTTASRIQFSKS